MQVINDPKEGKTFGIPTWAAVISGFFLLLNGFLFVLILILFIDNGRIERRIDTEKREIIEIIRLLNKEKANNERSPNS